MPIQVQESYHVIFSIARADGEVDLFDAVAAAAAFGSSPGQPEWDELADLNGDGTVDIFDIILLCRYFD